MPTSYKKFRCYFFIIFPELVQYELDETNNEKMSTQSREKVIFEKCIAVKIRHHENYWLHNKKFKNTQKELYIHLGYLLYKSRAEILFRLKG